MIIWLYIIIINTLDDYPIWIEYFRAQRNYVATIRREFESRSLRTVFWFVNETTIIIIRAFKYFLIFLMYKNISWKFPLRGFTAPYPTPQRKWILSTFSEVWNTNLPKWRRRGFCESSTRTDSISSINRRTWDNTSPRKLSCLNDDNEQ